MNKVSSNQN